MKREADSYRAYGDWILVLVSSLEVLDAQGSDDILHGAACSVGANARDHLADLPSAIDDLEVVFMVAFGVRIRATPSGDVLFAIHHDNVMATRQRIGPGQVD